MALLRYVDLKFILEAPNMHSHVIPVTMGLQASRIDSTILSTFIDAACGHLSVKVDRPVTMQQAVDAMVIPLKDQDRIPAEKNVEKIHFNTDSAPADPPGVKHDKLSPKSKSRSQKIVKTTNRSRRTLQCPFCEEIMNTRVIHGHCRIHHQDKYNPGDVTRYIKGIPATAAGSTPAAAADPPGDPGPIPIEFKPGIHVKQIKAINGNKNDGIGIVQGRKGNMIEVSFQSGKYDRLPDVCLEVV